MIINCDIGERGARHPVDHQLMDSIGMANIACGGHAGDAESVAAFTRSARERGVLVAAHLSYPDRENFGRVSLDIPMAKLTAALEEQLELSLEKQRVKPHGALYNDCCVNTALAEGVAEWLQRRGVTEVVTAAGGALAVACQVRGIKLLAEAFAERRYTSLNDSGQLVLVSRSKPYASIVDLEEAVAHSKKLIGGCVDVVTEQADGRLVIVEQSIAAQTLCIHSDSTIALPLAKRLAALLRGRQT